MIVTDKQIEETAEKIKNWAGDYSKDHYIVLLAELMTGGYALSEFRKDVEGYDE